jgi:hypothetical protein
MISAINTILTTIRWLSTGSFPLFATLMLLILLASQEIIWSSNQKQAPVLIARLNLALVPLLIFFIATVVVRVISVIN